MRLTRNSLVIWYQDTGKSAIDLESYLFVTIMLGSQNSTTTYIIITLLNALLKTTQLIHRASFTV